ncbi:MAG: acyltransferase, partial [Mesorhizobium sp.]
MLHCVRFVALRYEPIGARLSQGGIRTTVARFAFVSAPSPDFRPDIEGLRALAVAGVVAFHFGFTALPGGFAGVDIFFVISGYLITRHLVSEISLTGRLDLLRFYARRARRLLPVAL